MSLVYYTEIFYGSSKIISTWRLESNLWRIYKLLEFLKTTSSWIQAILLQASKISFQGEIRNLAYWVVVQFCNSKSICKGTEVIKVNLVPLSPLTGEGTVQQARGIYAIRLASLLPESASIGNATRLLNGSVFQTADKWAFFWLFDMFITSHWL